MKYAMMFVAVALAACTDPKEATRILEENGYTDVEMTGYSFFACSKDDFFHTGFKATSVIGKSVEGTVCSGFLFKNSTIRF